MPNTYICTLPLKPIELKKHIPNLLTLLNLISGSSGIIASMNGSYKMAFGLMILAAIFDFLDGMVARILGVSGELGKELDSLSDVVSFGVLPSIIMYNLMNLGLGNHESMMHFGISYFPFLALIIGAMSSYRLAKFNLDTRQSNSFIGLPTPANAIFIGALSLLIHLHAGNDLVQIIGHPLVLMVISLVMSYLLIAEIPLFALKFKDLHWQGNEIRFVFIGISIGLLLLYMSKIYFALILIIPLYIGLSIINNFLLKGKAIGHD
jgi:CDP-diacylglycerol--serine O-phosphatidyltransferase